MATGADPGTSTSGAVVMGTKTTEEERDNTMAMFIMAGMVVSSAGFAMYTRQADSLLKRMSRASKIQGLANSSHRTKSKSNLTLTSSDSNRKAKTFHEKDDFF
eukprot:jgi/Psemu1/301527/fgenesh1_kg.37_\